METEVVYLRLVGNSIVYWYSCFKSGISASIFQKLFLILPNNLQVNASEKGDVLHLKSCFENNARELIPLKIHLHSYKLIF